MSRHRRHQPLRQRRHRPPFVRLLKTSHQDFRRLGVGSHLEQPLAARQIRSSAGLGITANDTTEDVLAHERLLPKRPVGKQSQHLVRMRGALRLQRPPNHQRLVNVSCIGIVREQLANDRQRLADRQPLGRGGELAAHLDVRLSLGQADERTGCRLRHDFFVAK